MKTNGKWKIFDLSFLRITSPQTYDHIETKTGYRKSEIEELPIIDFNESFEEDIRIYRTYKSAPLLIVNNGGMEDPIGINGGKFGLFIWQDGLNSLNEYLPTEYDELKTYDFFVLAKKNNHWICYDYEGREIFSPMQSYTFTEYDANNNIFLVNNEGGELVSNSNWFDDRHYAGGKFGYLNSDGKVIIPLEYDYVRPKFRYSEDIDSLQLIKVGKNGKFGLINIQGKTIIPLIYDEIDDHIFSYNDFMDIEPYYYSNGLLKVRQGTKWGMINWQNEAIIPCLYDKILQSDKYYQVERNGKFHYFNSEGKSIQKPRNVYFSDKKTNVIENVSEEE